METRIDIGRKVIGGVWDGSPDYLLHCWSHYRGGIERWVVNAHSTNGGSYCSGGPKLYIAIASAVKFLLDRGEPRELIIHEMFQKEQLSLAQALFGWFPSDNGEQ